MSGRVSSLYGSRSGTGADQHYVPLDQAAYHFLPIAGRCRMLSANVCAGFICFCYGEWMLVLLGFPSYSQYSGYGGVPFAGPALGREVGGSIIFVTVGSFLDHTKKCFDVSEKGLCF